MRIGPLLLVGATLLIQSCSLFVPSMSTVAITASDPRAEIFVDGAPVGRGAVTTRVKRNESHMVMARVGDRTGMAAIGTSISGTGVLDIVGGIFFLVPLIGIAGPGFFKLDSTTVMVHVPPQ